MSGDIVKIVVKVIRMEAIVHSPAKTRLKSKSQAQVNMEQYECERQQLRQKREQLQELRQDLERLRTELQQQQPVNNNRETSRLGSPHRGDGGLQAIQGLMSHLKFPQVDIKVPSFSESVTVNPREFLENVKRYLRYRNVANVHEKMILETT